MFAIGFILGVIYELSNFIKKFKKIFVIQIILDIVISISFSAIFILMLNLINYGQFRLFLLLGYTIGFIMERITLSKLFAKCGFFVYNNVVNLLKKFSKSKLGRMIFK